MNSSRSPDLVADDARVLAQTAVSHAATRLLSDWFLLLGRRCGVDPTFAGRRETRPGLAGGLDVVYVFSVLLLDQVVEASHGESFEAAAAALHADLLDRCRLVIREASGLLPANAASRLLRAWWILFGAEHGANVAVVTTTKSWATHVSDDTFEIAIAVRFYGVAVDGDEKPVAEHCAEGMLRRLVARCRSVLAIAEAIA